MTSPNAYLTADALGKRATPASTYRARRVLTFERVLADHLEASTKRTELTFPLTQYQNDLVGFARDICGVYLYAKQREIASAVHRHWLIAVASGHKVGKTLLAAVIAWWGICCFRQSRVLIFGPKKDHIRAISWRDIVIVQARSGVCWECRSADPDRTVCEHSVKIPWVPPDNPLHGVRTPYFSEMIGVTGAASEGTQGYATSGKLIVLVDEASSIADGKIEGIKSNLAGADATLILNGNPIRLAGEFARALLARDARKSDEPASDDDYYATRISSYDSPNVTGEITIPGLATLRWIRMMEKTHGRESPAFLARVLGQHPKGEQGRVFSLERIAQANARHAELILEGVRGELTIGIDPAGEDSVDPDDWGCVAVVGDACVRADALVQGSVQAAWDWIREIRLAHAKQGTETIVNVDREGSIGFDAFKQLQRLAEDDPSLKIQVNGVRASDHPRSHDQKLQYVTIRDAMAGTVAQWIRTGALPLNERLAGELGVLLLVPDPGRQMRSRLTPKKEIKRQIGRSPDLYDGLALALWREITWTGEHGDGESDTITDLDAYAELTAIPDPYWEQSQDIHDYVDLDPYE